MPSPFPGMDPYLEAPGLWPDVHHEMMSVAREMLNIQLRPRYHVRLEERVYVSDENDPARDVIIPDLKIMRATNKPAASAATGNHPSNTAVAEPVFVTTLIDDEIREAYLVVMDLDSRNVVAVIEVLSPTNKISGSRGRSSYEDKRHDSMLSPTHFIEIDLLRAGVPIHTREPLPRSDYTVHVSRKDKRPKAWIWPILLTQRLPVIPIPLKAGDTDAQLDLQKLLATVYERAAYDVVLDYKRDPVPPLPDRYKDWAQELLAGREQ